MRFTGVLFVSFFFWMGPRPCLAYTLDRLDDVFLESQDTRAFLNSPDLLERYFNILYSYFGRAPQRAQFDAIVERLRRSVDESSDYGRYLEETPKLPPAFEFSTDVKVSGRDLNLFAWSDYWTRFLDSLAAQAQDANLGGADASLLLRKIRSPEMATFFRSQDPDLVLYALKNLWEENLDAAIHTRLPNPSTLIENPWLFPLRLTANDRGMETIDEGSAGMIRLRPIPRRIHGIFRTLYSGGVQSADVDRITTENSPDSQIHFIEKDGVFIGYTRLTPVKIGIRTYAYMEIGAPLLRQRAILLKDGKPHISTVFDLWLVHAHRQLPFLSSGILASENPHTDNQTTIQMVTQSSAFALGKQLGSGLVVLNPRATQLSPDQFSRMIRRSVSGQTRVRASHWLLSSTTAQARMIRGAIADKVSEALLAENADIYQRARQWPNVSDDFLPLYNFSWKVIRQAICQQPEVRKYAWGLAAFAIGGLYVAGWSEEQPTDLLSHLKLLGMAVGTPASMPYLLAVFARALGAMDPVIQEVGTRLALGHAAATRAGPEQGRFEFCARYIAGAAGF